MYKPNMEACPSKQTRAGRPPGKSLTVQAVEGLWGVLDHCPEGRRATDPEKPP